MMRDLAVAAVQSVPVVGDIAENLLRAESLVQQAADADLVVFPELSLVGYDLELLANDAGVWFRPGDERLDAVRRLAAERRASVIVGAPVQTGGHRYIASLVLTGTGPDLVAPKTHLHGAEHDLVEAGPGPTMITVGSWKLGLAVCLDTGVADHARAAHEAGADAYVTSVLYTAGEEEKLATRMSARAAEHGMWSLAANLGGHPVGERSAGGSGVWAPDGTRTAAATGRDEELVVAVLSEFSGAA